MSRPLTVNEPPAERESPRLAIDRSATTTLDQMPRGARVRVVDITRRVDLPETLEDGDPIARRLDDLGLRTGVEIEVIRRAPLGDPTVFELHGYQLCLRRSETARVRVEPSADRSETS